MPRKKKCPPAGPNMSYMISFGDTMTALLAFFIVLNSMAEEQTGANLHAGTGSFVATTTSFGLPGSFTDGRSKHAFQLANTDSMYVVRDPNGESDSGEHSGPDDEDDRLRILNRQKDEFHRFLNEIEQFTPTEAMSGIDGEASWDILSAISDDGPVMNEDIEAAVVGVAHMLRRPGREIQLTVWCQAPSEISWKRALGQAARLRQEVIEMLNLPPQQQASLSAMARPWISSTVKRPTVTVSVLVDTPPPLP